MTSPVIRIPLVLLLIATLGACSGWGLRGMREKTIAVDSVHVRAGGAQQLRRALMTELVNSGIRLEKQRTSADAVIELDEESFDRRVLSVDADTGKVREVELGLQVQFSVRGKEGKLLVPPERLSWVQDFVFDENSILGTRERATIIKRELAEDAAQTIRLRLETIDFAAR